MNVADISSYIDSLFNTTFPDDEIDLVITAVSGGRITIGAGIVGGANSGWRFGICKFTDGDAIGGFRVVAASSATGLVFGESFAEWAKPAVGDKVTLQGAPLNMASKYLMEPSALDEADDDETVTGGLVIIQHVVRLEDEKVTLGREVQGTWDQDIQLAIEQSVPHRLMATVDDQINYWSQLMQIQEQVRFILKYVRNKAALGVKGEGPI